MNDIQAHHDWGDCERIQKAKTGRDREPLLELSSRRQQVVERETRKAFDFLAGMLPHELLATTYDHVASELRQQLTVQEKSVIARQLMWLNDGRQAK